MRRGGGEKGVGIEDAVVLHSGGEIFLTLNSLNSLPFRRIALRQEGDDQPGLVMEQTQSIYKELA